MRTLTCLFVMPLITLGCLNCYAETPSYIRVGVMASLTDEWANIGGNIVKGAKLAASELNQSGGIHGDLVDLVVEDSREANSGAHALTAYQSLRQREIFFFIGPTGTPAGLALAPILQKESSVIVLTPSVGVRDFSDSAPNIFNTRGIDEAGSKLTADYAIHKTWKSAAVLASQQPWVSAQGQTFKKEFEQRGGKIVFYDEPLPDANDLRTPLTKLLETKPEVVFLSNMNRISLASRHLKLLGYKGPILTTPLDASSIKNSDGALEGAVFASFVSPTESFTKKFMQTYNARPDYGADAAYDAVIALGNALRRSRKNDTAGALSELSKVHFAGAAGDFSFGADRVAKRPLVQWKVVGSEMVRFEEG